MKKISIFASMLFALVAFTACSTDRDDNPTLVVPGDGFTLYAPGITANVIDLDNSSSLTFKANQPNYGYTAPITYIMQFAASEDGTTWSEFSEVATTNTDPLAIIATAGETAGAVTTGLVELGRSEADFPLKAFVKARVRAFVTGAEETTSIYSEEVQFTVTTSYVLPPIPSTRYYITGDLVGWGDGSAITAIFYPAEGNDVYSYTSKFTDGNLKFWYEDELGDWDHIYGTATDGDTSLSGDVAYGNVGAIHTPTADQYYTFTFDKQHMTYSWTLLDDQAPATYSNISLIGSFNEWNDDVDMTEVAPNNWYVEYTFADDNTEFKFRANHDWGTNWGATWTVADDDWHAIGVGGGDNIIINAGTYRFYINDITSQICVVPVK